MVEKQKRRALRWLRDGAAVIVLVLAVGWWQTRDLVPTGARAPERPLPALGGGQVQFARDAAAPVTLVYFFAPWCGVCKVSSGNLHWLARILGPSRLRIVPIALEYESVEDVATYAREHPFPTPVALGDEETRRAFRITAFPSYYVLDGDLQVKHASVGYSTLAGLVARILL